MKDYLCEDTIAAISTPLSKGAIGIVRISGKKALEILKKVFRTKSGKPKETFENRKMTYGIIVDENNDEIDEVLAVYMKGPKTFTGEDVVEIHSHGGIYVVRKILKRVLSEGARLAEPGEFTKRAFLNGRIDLVQAEAINEIINAESELSLKVAVNHLKGSLSSKIESIRDMLFHLKAFIEAAVDFPEEEIEIIETGKVKEKVEKATEKIEKLLETYDDGRIIREGIKIAIAGRPNVGKSSLLNALLKEERAIVTDIPGTTRDVIEEAVTLKGIPVRLIDTAGIREAKDVVEKIGIDKTKEKLKEADIILFVIDGSTGFTEEDKKIYETLKDNPNLIVVINKKDQGLKVSCKDFENTCVEISAKEGEGIEVLSEVVMKKLLLEPETLFKETEAMITSERHKNLLEKALKSLQNMKKSIEYGIESPEFLALDLDEALNALGEIVGKKGIEDMLDIIFSTFCIGK
ncbi:tRNA uridine-5-carboxymethylaminomethyl(34) synthesis GTPase MnmE [Desulfurobacterium indicum]|uniref:tRNA modification GTPase MnmE n=1 Tax=Desulfurobacterium indicum TaxID=1914305 RepID=A0A1R1MKN1_9BACT|nr:tRNA uridine-5-carboxymethylaminomethyl(34) synthesis GTPase MnmE [Desulfurobacterium indicum]OMH40365.1 tRNA uridine-5-carboxymethylaminomethyl(34) synthesis GTPase MnmE [Desulfurobacterium indicum]